MEVLQLLGIVFAVSFVASYLGVLLGRHMFEPKSDKYHLEIYVSADVGSDANDIGEEFVKKLDEALKKIGKSIS